MPAIERLLATLLFQYKVVLSHIIVVEPSLVLHSARLFVSPG